VLDIFNGLFRCLGFNIRTVARGTIDTRIRSRRKLYTKINYCTAMLNVTNSMNP